MWRNKWEMSNPYLKNACASLGRQIHGQVMQRTSPAEREREERARWETQQFNRITNRNMSIKNSAFLHFISGSWLSTENLPQSECTSCQSYISTLRYNQQWESFMTLDTGPPLAFDDGRMAKASLLGNGRAGITNPDLTDFKPHS